ncbi:hypothetical protein [Streptomyces chrestomyceticus]|uniref:hypothetical protein n=1 Tax=Streptomyces chrestomyceticus TaxID=68185 RepID=UPI0033D7155F
MAAAHLLLVEERSEQGDYKLWRQGLDDAEEFLRQALHGLATSRQRLDMWDPPGTDDPGNRDQ